MLKRELARSAAILNHWLTSSLSTSLKIITITSLIIHYLSWFPSSSDWEVSTLPFSKFNVTGNKIIHVLLPPKIAFTIVFDIKKKGKKTQSTEAPLLKFGGHHKISSIFSRLVFVNILHLIHTYNTENKHENNPVFLVIHLDIILKNYSQHSTLIINLFLQKSYISTFWFCWVLIYESSRTFYGKSIPAFKLKYKYSFKAQTRPQALFRKGINSFKGHVSHCIK